MSTSVAPPKHPFGLRSSSPRAILTVGEAITAAILLLVAAVSALEDAPPLAVVCGVLVFGAAYAVRRRVAGLFDAHPRGRVLWLVGLGLAWFATVWISFSFTWVAFVLFILAGHLLRGPIVVAYSAAVLAIVWAATFAHNDVVSVGQLLGPTIGGIVAIGMTRGYVELLRILGDLERAHEEMAYLQDELAATQRESGAREERTRISQDIHDTIAQGLSSIRLLAQPENPTSPEEKLEHIEAIATDNLAEVRRIVADLAPHELERNPLAAALRTMVVNLTATTDIAADLEVDADVQLSSEIDIALLRVAQSALANVRLHSRARRARVTLSTDERHVRLDVVDNGVGFDVEQWEQNRASTSFGLSFMRARLEKLGGGVDIESTPGEGTAISAWVPL